MPEKEVPVKDFFEEHRRLKEGGIAASPAPPQPVQPSAQPPKPATPPQPPLPSQPAAPRPAAQPPARVFEPEPQAQQLSFVQLVEQLRGLGYDVKALEALKGFADLLDAEEQKLMKEINERQKRLETVREARRLLRALGL